MTEATTPLTRAEHQRAAVVAQSLFAIGPIQAFSDVMQVALEFPGQFHVALLRGNGGQFEIEMGRESPRLAIGEIRDCFLAYLTLYDT